MLSPAFIGEIVNRVAPKYGLRPDIVLCIILQESQGNPFANRFEKHIYNRLVPLKREELSGWKPDADYNDKELEPSLETEKVNRAISWGLMQVLGETGRWCARVSVPFLSALQEPELGADTGCKVLSYYLKTHGTYDKALAAYNAGTPTSTQGQQYARKVLFRLSAGEHKAYLQG